MVGEQGIVVMPAILGLFKGRETIQTWGVR